METQVDSAVVCNRPGVVSIHEIDVFVDCLVAFGNVSCFCLLVAFPQLALWLPGKMLGG